MRKRTWIATSWVADGGLRWSHLRECVESGLVSVGSHTHTHLNLSRAGTTGVPVAYELTPAHRVALLTGANSGGKTTLLETLAQVAILAHLGLPVNAKHAVVPPIDGVYFFTQKRSLDAGASQAMVAEIKSKP